MGSNSDAIEKWRTTSPEEEKAWLAEFEAAARHPLRLRFRRHEVDSDVESAIGPLAPGA